MALTRRNFLKAALAIPAVTLPAIAVAKAIPAPKPKPKPEPKRTVTVLFKGEWYRVPVPTHDEMQIQFKSDEFHQMAKTISNSDVLVQYDTKDGIVPAENDVFVLGDFKLLPESKEDLTHRMQLRTRPLTDWRTLEALL